MYLIDDRVEQFLLLHKPVIHRLLLDKLIDGAVLPLSVVTGAESVHFRAHVLFHLDLLTHAIDQRFEPLILILLQMCHDVAIRLNNFDELIGGNFDYVGRLTNNFAACLIKLLLLDGLLSTDGNHLAYVAQIDDFDIFLLIPLHMLRMVRISLHGLLKNFLYLCVLEIWLVLVDPT